MTNNHPKPGNEPDPDSTDPANNEAGDGGVGDEPTPEDSQPLGANFA